MRPHSEQLTEEQAIALCSSKWWEEKSPYDVAFFFQLSQERLCLPFELFQKAVEQALGRPVWTHEFAYPDLLWGELQGLRKAPDLGEILSRLFTIKRNT